MTLHFYPTERVAVFIDGANLYSAARTLGFDIDYKKLLDMFQAKARLVRAFYYTALHEEQEYSPIRPLIDWLDYNGYTMVTKPLKEFTDSMGRRKVKGNMDIELAIDMMEIAPNIDHAVLFSGDGDFRRLVEAVQRRGTRVTVVSSIRTQPPMVADELRRQADNFVDLQDLAAEIARPRDPAREAQREQMRAEREAALREARAQREGLPYEDEAEGEDGPDDNIGNTAPMADRPAVVEPRPGYGAGYRPGFGGPRTRRPPGA